MAWTILRTVQCWEKYRTKMTVDLGLTGMHVEWGNGPKEYPCLITTYVPPSVAGQAPRIVSAYVFRSDAEDLLRVAGVKPPAQEMPPVPKVVVKQPETLEPLGGQQDAFNRWVTAYLIALVRENREVGVLKPEKFEQSLNEALQLVDETATERRDAVIKALDGTEKAIIDRLKPPG